MSKQVFIIAEAGVNHNGSLDLALQLVDAAAEVGADAVKFQTFKASNLVTASAPKANYQISTTGSQESQMEMLKRLELKPEYHGPIMERCRKRGIEFISTPFDLESLQLLVKLEVRQLKIPSGELTNAPLLLAAAQSGLPVILSTGMATLEEVRTALGVLAFGYSQATGEPSSENFRQAYETDAAILKEKLVLLHCTTEYPSPLRDTNLKAMDTLRDEFSIPTGLSDHTEGFIVAAAAAARGATVIEKHMTLDRNMEGPDHLASLDPAGFRQLVSAIRDVELALGTPLKAPTLSETENLRIVRKSLTASRPIAAGELFSTGNLTAKRPGTGLSPLFYWDLLGRKADRPYQMDEPIPPDILH
jgi:N-acetylneuraminate synthase